MLISHSMDQKLPLMKRLSIRLHVSVCSLCLRYQKQLHMLRKGTHYYADPEENEVEEYLSTEAKERLKSALERTGR